MTGAAPVAILVAASIFSYSELSPFLLLSLTLSTILFAMRKRSFLPYLIFGLLVTVLSAVLLNVEIVRTIRAITVQKDAVVGTAGQLVIDRKSRSRARGSRAEHGT